MTEPSIWYLSGAKIQFGVKHTKRILQIALVAILATFAMADDETSARDRSRLSVFVQPAVSFLDFPEREYFQNAIDTLYYSFRQDALTESESLSVAKQDFQ